MTPNRARAAIGEQVLIHEGTAFEVSAIILAVEGNRIVCHDGRRIVYAKYNTVTFAPGVIDHAEIETFWAKETQT